jgi:hypothetical protein
MILAGAGADDLLQEHLDSMRRNALQQEFFQPALSSSVSAPASVSELQAIDPAWAWDAPVAHRSPVADAALNPVAAERESAKFLRGERRVTLEPRADFALSEETEASFDPEDPTRPILACPFASVPSLPLIARTPDLSATTDGSLPQEAAHHQESLPTVETLVSLGGVGGVGLGSHSLLDARYLAACVGVAVSEGIACYRTGRAEEAVSKLLPLQAQFSMLGGSAEHADLLSLTLTAAATQSRQLLLARALLRDRATRAPNNGQVQYHLSSVLFATGEYRQAAQARDRALGFGLGQARHMARLAHPDGAMGKNLEPFRG